jgi:hypothetical protein
MLLALGCRLIYLDIDPKTLCVSEASIESLAASNPDVFLNIRTLGYEGDLSSLFQFVKRLFPKALIVDDKCLCRPRLTEGQHLPENVDLELYSTGYSKYVDFGVGGYALAKLSTWSSQESQYNGDIFAELSLHEKAAKKADDLSWVDDRPYKLTYFPHIESTLPLIDAHKIRINNIYRDHLKGAEILEDHLHWRFNFLCEQRERIRNKIFEAGLFCSSHYAAAPIGEERTADYPVGRNVARRIVNLFNDFRITEDNARTIGRIVQRELHHT